MEGYVRRRRAGVLVAGVLILLAAFAAVVVHAALPQQSGVVDMSTQANGEFDGAAANNSTGFGVAAAGDVNGDGLADVIVSAPNASGNGRSGAGAAYVVFGQPSAAQVDLDNPGPAGFRIDGAAAGDNAGTMVAGAGDVNGDGKSDLILSAQHASSSGRNNSGSAYVVFGKASSTTVDLANLGSSGFRIDGAAIDDVVTAVSSAGDLNNDGHADVIVGAWGADNNGTTSGSAYVVFGKSSTGTVDLLNVGAQGFRIDGAAANDAAGFAVGSVGDMNGDGIPELLVSALQAGNNTRANSGSAYVVFGKSSTTNIALGSLGSQGFRIDGAVAGDNVGSRVHGLGDVNGDGTPDLILSSTNADNNGRTDSGSAWVVFGKSSTANVDLLNLGSQGFRIDGAAAGDAAGSGVGNAGDVNGDGKPDAIVGAFLAGNNGRSASGSAYVVFGGNTANIDLLNLGSQGFRIDGGAMNDTVGNAVDGAGDVNGDGRADVVVGAPHATVLGRTNTGAAYEVYGFGVPAVSYPSTISASVGQAIAPVAPTVARTGAPSFSISPPLPAGLSIDPATGVISGAPTQAQPQTTHTVTMTDLSGAATAPVQVTVTGAGSPPPAGTTGKDTTAPVVSAFAITPRKFAVARTATAISARAKRGAVFSYTLSETATSRISISRMLPGRRVGRSCRRPTAKLRHAKRCTRLVAAGRFTRKNQPAGKNKVKFSGRIGRRALAPGKYRAAIVAVDAAGNRSAVRRIGFTIVRG